ncbi:hypothetical protein N0V87_009283 [Didymella glomerata]|uniref:Uncharacterized protein n=1 Tax=Didymella glomerata TaxID=749621 RepID=A0A9W8WRF8_9PLEO|nr:hypothetical protein N0V87_009283 [Didymella glomerata]
MRLTASSTIVPAVPVVPVTPVKPETPAKGKKGKQAAKAVEGADPTPAATSKHVPVTPPKPSTKAVAAKTPAASEAASKTEGDAAAKKPELIDKKPMPETPSKASAKSKAANKKAEKAEKITAEDVTYKTAAKEPANVPAAPGAPTANTKRQPPGKLDISLAKIVEKEPTPSTSARKEEPQAKTMRIVPPTTTSVPASPAVAAPSPVKHTAAPRTLRLVSTPKVETPPAVAAPTPPLPQIPTVDKLRSRQASIASLNQPGTPASDLVSDTASMTSGMISRASSPPPTNSIVGSAPVRKITKAQAKKNRQERKRQEEEKEKVENGSDVEVVQAPIIGRKKKAKKPSTTPKPVAAMASAMKEAAAKSQPASPKSATVEDEPLETPTVASVKAQSAHNSASATPEPEVQPDESRERREPNAQSILNDLQKSGEVLVSALEFFKPLASTLTHTSRTPHTAAPTSPPDQKIHFSQADLDALAKKRPVHLSGEHDKPDSRTLITPNGKFLWGLTAELEERALSLESEIERLSGYLRFHPSSHTAQHTAAPYSSDMLPAIATALKEAGKKMPTSPTNTLTFDYKTYTQHLPPVTEFAHQPPPPVQQQTPADAGAYLNQFVLPATDNPPPNHPRPEMAAVGGTPGSGTSQISIASSGQQGTLFERAARALVEGGAVGSTDIDGVASLVPDKEGGVWLEGLQGLVGAGIPSLGSAWESEGAERFVGDLEHVGWDSGSKMPRQHTVEYSVKGGRISSRSVLGLEEAESVLASARKEQDALERKLGALVKRNRKAALGNVR